jgi:fido (protein-threonine AMPylation protein)
MLIYFKQVVEGVFVYREEARKFIKGVFEKYNKRKKEGTLYNEDDSLPQNIITLYYVYFNISNFKDIIDAFKRKYISNETKLEGAAYCERKGLGKVYDYIQDFDVHSKSINLYYIFSIHQLLYSECHYPQFGGSYRNYDVYLPHSMVIIPDFSCVPYLMDELYKRTNKFISDSNREINAGQLNILEYIKECVNIKCELIRIHPFPDGNGRTSRAFMNLLFKKVGLPPVYVEEKEKAVYGLAMNKALVDNNYEDIYKFYYYKICDSIYELDVKHDFTPIHYTGDSKTTSDIEMPSEKNNFHLN